MSRSRKKYQDSLYFLAIHIFKDLIFSQHFREKKKFSQIWIFYILFGVYALCEVKMYHIYPQNINSLLPGGI